MTNWAGLGYDENPPLGGYFKDGRPYEDLDKRESRKRQREANKEKTTMDWIWEAR